MKKSIPKKTIAIYSNLTSGGAVVIRDLITTFISKDFIVVPILEPKYKISNIIEYLYASLILSPNNQKRLLSKLHFNLLIVHHSWLVKTPSLLRYTNQPKLYFCHDVLREYYDYQHISQQSLKDKVINTIRIPIKWLDAVNIKAKKTTVIANSKYSKSIIDKSYGVNSVIIYPGIMTKIYRPNSKNKKRNQVLMVSAINKLKRQDFIIDVISHMNILNRPDLVLIGNGYDKKYLEYLIIKSKQLKVNTIFKLDASEKEKILIMHESKVFLYAPVSEPFGLVVAEAISAGIPVLAYKMGGGYAELISNKNGQIMENLDVISWSEHLERLLSDEKRMDKIRKYNINYAARKLDIEYMNAKILKLINKNL